MSIPILAGLSLAVFLTSLLSGIFGMAGGLILLWVLMLMMPVATAIAIHGIIQMVSNGARAWFSRHYVDWKILAILIAGLVIAAIFFLIVDYKPNIVAVSIAIGLMPLLVWLPTNRLTLDASRPAHAFFGGLLAGALTIGVGVSGPTIDIFFIRTQMDRRKVIATKAATQLISHGAKVVFYWNATDELTGPVWLSVALAAPLALVGAQVGYQILQRMTDANFRAWTRWIVTAIGGVYLVQGLAAVF